MIEQFGKQVHPANHRERNKRPGIGNKEIFQGKPGSDTYYGIL